MERFVVIGLGAFGAAVARRLHERGAEVLGIDADERNVDDLKDDVSRAVIADATDRDALDALGVDRFETAIVAIGENREANILVTALLKEIGIHRIVARATNPLHARILHAIGVNQVVSPEQDLGRRLADSLSSEYAMERFPLAEGVELGEFEVTGFMAGKSLRDLDLRGRFSVNVVSIQRRKKKADGAVEPAAEGNGASTGDAAAPQRRKMDVATLPDPNEKLTQGDVLVMIGATEALDALAKEYRT